MPVHLYGHPTDMRAIRKLADEHGLKVLEDAAPALGAEIEGRKVGQLRRRGLLQLSRRENHDLRRGRNARDERRSRSTSGPNS